MGLPFLKHRIGGDKGSMLIEAMVSLALIALLMTGYTTSSARAHSVQRTAVNITAAAQAAQAEVETVRALSWSKIGTNGNPATAIVLDDGSSAAKDVTTGSIPVTQTKTVRGTTMTIVTNVGWKYAPRTVNSATGEKSDYGAKVVTVHVSWQEGPGGASSSPAHTKKFVQQAIITSGIDEAAPSHIRGA